ncbi:MAG: ComEA family DNA-binding protein [bacterium]
MNKREIAVLLFLSSVFLLGALINGLKHLRLKQQLAANPVQITYPDSIISDTLIDINQATLEQLDALPGIGPVLAQRIIDYRERHGGFKRIDELQNVAGIGLKRFAAIKDLLTCRPPMPSKKSAD